MARWLSNAEIGRELWLSQQTFERIGGRLVVGHVKNGPAGARLASGLVEVDRQLSARRRRRYERAWPRCGGGMRPPTLDDRVRRRADPPDP
jgi:hypothetical protein